MNMVLWIVQGLLAFAFAVVGFNHAFRPEKLRATPRMAWITSVPPKLMTFIGIAEMAGGLGIVLPMLTGVLPLAHAACCGATGTPDGFSFRFSSLT